MKFQWFLMIAGLTVLAYGSDVWKKDFTQWSQDDVERILKDSPWAKETLAHFDAELAKQHHDPGTGISIGANDPVNGGMPAGPGRPPVVGMSGPLDTTTAQMPTMDLTVRWESALPVKQALLKLSFGDKLPAESDPAYRAVTSESDYYVVSIVGLELPRKRKKPGEEESGQDRMRDEFLATARILRRGGNFIGASNVKVNPPEARDEVLFFFPKTDPLSLSEKEVTFEAEQGAFVIRRVFRLKDMVYHGKLEL